MWKGFRVRGRGSTGGRRNCGVVYNQGPILRTIHSNHRVSQLLITRNIDNKDIATVVTGYGRHSVLVGRMDPRGLSCCYDNTGRRNITILFTRRRCYAISSVFGGTRDLGRGPFVVIYSRVRSPRGLNTVVHATRTYHIRNVVVPGEHDTSLGTAITGDTYNTLRCVLISHIAGVPGALSLLGRGNI